MTVTELVAFSVGARFLEVRGDILAGQIGTLTARPLPYWLMKLAEWSGHSAALALVLGVTGFAAATAITGHWPWTGWRLLAFAPALAVAIVLLLLLQLMVGLVEIWGPHARPAHWITQKFLFLLGGLFLPLVIYPAWFATVAWFTPFPAILFAPASMVFAPTALEVGLGFGLQVVWLALGVGAALSLHALVLRHIGREGDQA